VNAGDKTDREVIALGHFDSRRIASRTGYGSFSDSAVKSRTIRGLKRLKEPAADMSNVSLAGTVLADPGLCFTGFPQHFKHAFNLAVNPWIVTNDDQPVEFGDRSGAPKSLQLSGATAVLIMSISCSSRE